MTQGRPRRVAVLGAGLAGLSAAYELRRRGGGRQPSPDVAVFEAASRVGGKIRTETQDGVRDEAGPESFSTAKPQARELVRVADRVIANAKNGRHIEVRRVIKDKTVYHKVFDVLAPRYKERPGGFTRILRLGQRKGDAAQVALVKLV